VRGGFLVKALGRDARLARFSDSAVTAADLHQRRRFGLGLVFFGIKATSFCRCRGLRDRLLR
jgi:hypothetical protein